MPEEKWKSVPECSDYYEVSDHGRVRRIAEGPGTHSGRILKPNVNSSGHYSMQMRCHYRRVDKLAHRLVAEAFIRPLRTKEHVHHKDGDKANNRLENLEILSEHDHRSLHAQGEGCTRSKLKEKDVREIRQLLKDGFGAAEISFVYDVWPQTVYRIRRGACWAYLT